MASTSTSLSLAFCPLFRPTPQPQSQPRHLDPKFPKPLRLSLAPALSCAAPLAAVPDGVAIDDIIEKDWSFLNASGSHLPRALAAGALSPASRVLAVTPTASFVSALLSESPCELLVAAHESLYVLGGIKEEHDQVRCFHLEGGGGGQGGGVVEAVPGRFDAFDVVFVCYFPGMGVSPAALLRSLAKRCCKGARVVIFLDQGRQSLAQHRRENPDLVFADLPSRSSLEKAADGSKFEMAEFIDESSLYLAVLLFQG
ncbi:hypothetical protein CFC21_051582 [Triticum aestivum]|uniref:Methyltransferase type 11 domain-containing protein n=2 Tax=Triticum aestivum TaxID=4565 RepID=A0A3B6HPT6_WHEAT|nr:uncharacterized protein LOC119285036 [Triticum dicoccoides]XP_044362807.1 uncharacterized protein LOC123085247 [Triticum aestivum]KAF7041848.1 hypothetical protein CFC21_051582 [Triticum aestivum]